MNQLINKCLECKVSKILSSIGLPRHLKGYTYLREAITMVVVDFDVIHSITKVLYPVIATKNQQTTGGIERAMKHVIAHIWTPDNIATINELFNCVYTPKDRPPCNSEFIALIADSIRLNSINEEGEINRGINYE